MRSKVGTVRTTSVGSGVQRTARPTRLSCSASSGPIGKSGSPRSCQALSSLAAAFVGLVTLLSSASGDTVVLTPSADTFLSEFGPDNNAGANANFAAGTVNNLTRTRALLRFPVSDLLPAGAVISNATLRLSVLRVSQGGGVDSLFDLRRVLVPWNEGRGPSNLGGAALPGETTWNRRLSPDVRWGLPGGALGVDFSSNVTASVQIGGPGIYDFSSSPGLVRDVQFWLEHPDANIGWVLLTEQEATATTSRRFGAREDAANGPALTVEYTVPKLDLRFTQLAIRDGQVNLAWTKVLASCQLQTRPQMTGDWVNVGEASFTNSLSIPLAGPQAFFRLISVGTNGAVAGSSVEEFSRVQNPRRVQGVLDGEVQGTNLRGGSHRPPRFAR